uniref:Retrotransposon gag domain-containing protein n=1 Tax=Tanacetum cinerariifolium TaxID=118510 RepID=A0A6L2LKA8_TANCI|nr:hypothetical protein [Tanacetum cinerariifolium]
MRELREDTFFKNKNEDAHEHVERVLNIISLFNIPRVSHDAVMLCIFSITLTGAAKRWVDRLPPGTVDSWELLKKSFIQRLPPQGGGKKHRGAKYGEFRRPSPFSNGAKYDVGPPGYYTRMDNRPPVREKRQSLEELMNKHLEEINVKKDRDGRMDMTKRSPIGIVENVLVKIDKFLFLSDFVVMVMLNTCNETMILGRPFLATIHAEIDVFSKEISLGIRDEYELGHMLEDIWENYRKVQGDNTYWWHDKKSEEGERQKHRINIEEYDPPMVHVETFKVKRYSFNTGQNFICVTKELMDALPFGKENGSRIRDMIRKEVDSGRRIRVYYEEIGIQGLLNSYSCGSKDFVLA